MNRSTIRDVPATDHEHEQPAKREPKSLRRAVEKLVADFEAFVAREAPASKRAAVPANRRRAK